MSKTPPPTADAGLAQLGDGFVSVLQRLHLAQPGLTRLQVEIVATITLLGSGLLTRTVGAGPGAIAHQPVESATQSKRVSTDRSGESRH